jgi:hypothetical protein
MTAMASARVEVASPVTGSIVACRVEVGRRSKPAR